MKFLVPLFVLVSISFSDALAQKAKKNKVKNPEAIFSHEPSSRSPNESEVSGAKKSNKVYGGKSFNQKLDQKVEEYHKRMKANEKKYKKMAKQMEKPQYSDPTYFGHKRKPKKRPPGKQKFCKECGIKH